MRPDLFRRVSWGRADLLDISVLAVFVLIYCIVVKYIADRTAVMEKGSIVEIGSSEAIFEHPSDAYTKELIDAVPMIGKTFRPPRQIHELQGL